MPIYFASVIIVIVSLMFHQITRGYIATFLGDETPRINGRLTLNPTKHLDLFGSVIIPFTLALIGSSVLFGWAKPMPYNPYNLGTRVKEILVILSAPLAGIFLILVSVVLLRLNFLPAGASELFFSVILINLFLIIINMLPLPGLDGSRFLSVILPINLARKYENITQRFLSHGLLSFVFVIIAVILLLDPIASVVFKLAAFFVSF